MRTLLIPDVHGDVDVTRGLLIRADVSLKPQERVEDDVRVIQLGDLANCVLESVGADYRILTFALEWFDTVLVGNHEYPYFGGPKFAGFHYDRGVSNALFGLDERGILKPCALVGETLLTHAGVADEFGMSNVRSLRNVINSAWRNERSTAPILTQIGERRGGRSKEGGIMWSDWDESRAPIRQVHGHSQRLDGPWTRTGEVCYGGKPSWAWNIDVGAGKRNTHPEPFWLDEDGVPEIQVPRPVAL